MLRIEAFGVTNQDPLLCHNQYKNTVQIALKKCQKARDPTEDARHLFLFLSRGQAVDQWMSFPTRSVFDCRHHPEPQTSLGFDIELCYTGENIISKKSRLQCLDK